MCLWCGIYALAARLSPTIQGPCCSCVCRVIPVPCLGSGFLRCHCRRALSCKHCCLQPVVFWRWCRPFHGCSFQWASGSLSRILLCPLAVLHPMLFFAALAALSSSPAPMPWSAPLLHCKKKEKEESKKRRQKKTKATRKNRERKKNGPGRTRASKFCVSARMAKEGNATPIGQQVLLLQCVSDVVSMPWRPDWVQLYKDRVAHVFVVWFRCHA